MHGEVSFLIINMQIAMAIDQQPLPLVFDTILI